MGLKSVALAAIRDGGTTQPCRGGKKTWPHPVISWGHLYLRDQEVSPLSDVKMS